MHSGKREATAEVEKWKAWHAQGQGCGREARELGPAWARAGLWVLLSETGNCPRFCTEEQPALPAILNMPGCHLGIVGVQGWEPEPSGKGFANMLPRSCPRAMVVEMGCLVGWGSMRGKAGRRAPGRWVLVEQEGEVSRGARSSTIGLHHREALPGSSPPLPHLADHKAFYVIFTWDQEAQIYELVAQTVSERKK